MLSVIVPSKNNGETLENCLRSIIDSHGDKEIIIVDAHSTDKTPEILEKYMEQIKVIYDEGGGLGIARNRGVEASSGDVVCFVDGDAYVSKNHFLKIVRCFDENPMVGVIAVEETVKISENPTHVEKLGCVYERERVRGEHKPHFAPGYFIAFRRKAFDDVGGFWSFPPIGGDDLDFTLRVRDRGWELGWVKTKGWHQLRKTILGMLGDTWRLGKGRPCFDKKYLNHPYVLNHVSRRRLYRFFGKKYWIYMELLGLFTPVLALRYLFRWRSIDVYFYWIAKKWTRLLAYMWGWLTWAKNIQ